MIVILSLSVVRSFYTEFYGAEVVFGHVEHRKCAVNVCMGLDTNVPFAGVFDTLYFLMHTTAAIHVSVRFMCVCM